MLWLHDLKARYEQQNKPDYLEKRNPSANVLNISGIRQKSCLEGSKIAMICQKYQN